jgi:hypothetical protein
LQILAGNNLKIVGSLQKRRFSYYIPNYHLADTSVHRGLGELLAVFPSAGVTRVTHSRIIYFAILSLAINTVTLKNKKILHLNFESVIFIRLFIVFSHFGANTLYNILRY